MRNSRTTGLTALCLTVGLALVAALDGGSALADAADEAPAPEAPTSTTEAPTTTTVPAPAPEAPPAEEAPAAPAADEAPPAEATTTTVATAPRAAPAQREAAPRRQTQPRRGGERWGPDPRWIDYGNCGRGITACSVAKSHQAQGLRQWRNGRWFRWGNDLVQGDRGETWAAFKAEARQRRYANAARNRGRSGGGSGGGGSLVAHWAGVANCESGGNWSINTGNGYYGGLQFSLSTWRAYGGQGYPHQQSAEYQASIAENVRTRSGLGHWPHCGRYYR